MIEDAIKTLQGIVNQYEELQAVILGHTVVNIKYIKNNESDYMQFLNSTDIVEWLENNLTKAE